MENAELNITKKKGHRRKAGGKRKKEKNNSHDRSMETMSDDPTEAPGAAPTSTVQADVLREDGEPPRKHVKMMPEQERKRQQQQHPQHALMHHQRYGAHRHPARRNPKNLLRPATVPKAPQNSTQFIIDDHENSAYFIDFERGFTSPGNREDVGWSPYFQQDFENVYRTTRESEPVDWSHVLLDKISSLEERVKSLEQQLAMCDPNVYMSQMHQHRIVCTENPNRPGIKDFRVWCPMHGKKVRFHNSSSESSSEDPSSSSSQSQDEEEGVQNGTGTDSSDEDTTDGEEATDERTAANSLNDRVPSFPNSQISATVEGDEEAAPSRMEDEEDGANAEEVNSSRRGSERTESVQSVEDIVNSEGP